MPVAQSIRRAFLLCAQRRGHRDVPERRGEFCGVEPRARGGPRPRRGIAQSAHDGPCAARAQGRRAAIRSEHEVDTAQTFDTQFVFAHSGFPELPASVRPAAYFGRWSGTVSVHGRRGAKQRIVDRVRVGLDVAREAGEHRADGFAGVPGLILEEDMVAVRKDDEEVRLATRPTFAATLDRRPGLDADAGRIDGQTEGQRQRRRARGLDDGAESGSGVLGVVAHRSAVERSALQGKGLLEPIERDAEQGLGAVVA